MRFWKRPKVEPVVIEPAAELSLDEQVERPEDPGWFEFELDPLGTKGRIDQLTLVRTTLRLMRVEARRAYNDTTTRIE